MPDSSARRSLACWAVRRRSRRLVCKLLVCSILDTISAPAREYEYEYRPRIVAASSGAWPSWASRPSVTSPEYVPAGDGATGAHRQRTTSWRAWSICSLTRRRRPRSIAHGRSGWTPPGHSCNRATSIIKVVPVTGVGGHVVRARRRGSHRCRIRRAGRLGRIQQGRDEGPSPIAIGARPIGAKATTPAGWGALLDSPNGILNDVAPVVGDRSTAAPSRVYTATRASSTPPIPTPHTAVGRPSTALRRPTVAGRWRSTRLHWAPPWSTTAVTRSCPATSGTRNN